MNQTFKKYIYIKYKSCYNVIFSGQSECHGRQNTTLLTSGLKRKYTMSITTRVLRHLLKGNTLTASEISGKFNAGNPTEVIRQLRMKGYAVYGNKSELYNGSVVTKYRIGTPSRAMVAAAYRNAGGDLF